MKIAALALAGLAALGATQAEAHPRRARHVRTSIIYAACPANFIGILSHPCLQQRVLRVRPASYVKAYPTGRLREDYAPYGMYGVRPSDYFDVSPRRRR